MTLHKSLVLCGLVAIGFTAARGWTAAPTPTDSRGRPLYEAGAVTVKLRSGPAPKVLAMTAGRFGIPSLDAVARKTGVVHIERQFRARHGKRSAGLPDLSRIYRAQVPASVDVRSAAALFAADSNVEYAEPIPARYVTAIPDDPGYSRQSYLRDIMAEDAWDVHKGEDGVTDVVVGVVDSGVQWSHPDLVDNMRHNLGEDADGDGRVLELSGDAWVFDLGDVNGVDDDGNGYVDDLVGWNFLNNAEGQDNDPDDPSNHGTHVAGIAGGRTNNGEGIASISWNVKLLAASTANSDSGESLPRAMQGIVYLAENGADIINMSFGGESTSELEREVIAYAQGLGCVLVGAAGNDDTSALHFPSALPGVISVASVRPNRVKASYSNYGISVDVAAPGGGTGGLIYSTEPDGYTALQGTSMACPVAAGLFALVKSMHPTWSNDQLTTQVLATADPVDDANPSYVGQLGSGRVNPYRALTEVPVISSPELRLAVTGVAFNDETGDGSVEAGEGAELVLTVRNYAHLTGSDSLTLTLSSADPQIVVLDPTLTVTIPPDSEVQLPAGLRFQVATTAPSGVYHLTLFASAPDASISPLSTLDVSMMVANGGILVWEGSQEATFSGRYLRDELEERDFDVVYASGQFPPGLVGFDAVFLCFGNAGLPTAARLDSEAKVAAIRTYLEDGGRVYIEGSDTLGWDIYNLVDGEVLLPLFGLDGGVDGDTNGINGLDGQNGTLTAGMRFTGTSQDPVEWIDIFTPSADGLTAFEESAYGIVAVQYEGAYGQRTFCFSYALGELTDGASTRSGLLNAIIDFFGVKNPADRMRPRTSGGRVSPGS